MSTAIDFSRRHFLKVSILAGGGLMLGFGLGPTRNADAADADFQPNAWITVHPDGLVTLVCARNEMGQDVYTSLTMLLAEELGVDLARVKVEQAPGQSGVHQPVDGCADHRRHHQHARCLGAVAQGGCHARICW